MKTISDETLPMIVHKKWGEGGFFREKDLAVIGTDIVAPQKVTNTGTTPWTKRKLQQKKMAQRKAVPTMKMWRLKRIEKLNYKLKRNHCFGQKDRESLNMVIITLCKDVCVLDSPDISSPNQGNSA